MVINLEINWAEGAPVIIIVLEYALIAGESIISWCI